MNNDDRGLVVESGTNAKPALDELSPQETRVLEQVAEGHTNREIAQILRLSPKTVKNYLSNAFQKLQVRRRSRAAALFARRDRT